VTPQQRIPILDLSPELQEVGADLEAAWRRVLASGHFILGPEVEAFEREVADYLGVRHAVGVNSGTDALVIALRALGIGPGDEVITSPFTFFATPESISAVGATPVFADVDPGTYNLRVDLVRAAVTARTRAVLPVHLFGHAADLDPLLALCQEKGLKLVEDVAQAFGGSYRGRKLGTFGAAGAYSFFPSKNLGCLGDGGLVATDDAAVADAAPVASTRTRSSVTTPASTRSRPPSCASSSRGSMAGTLDGGKLPSAMRGAWGDSRASCCRSNGPTRSTSSTSTRSGSWEGGVTH
jgi:dTDP-4-amino-4,6-dideoxygalactose transaminase